jgi:hypothetical protein
VGEEKRRRWFTIQLEVVNGTSACYQGSELNEGSSMQSIPSCHGPTLASSVAGMEE